MAPDVHAAAPLKLFQTREPCRVAGFGRRHDSEDLLEERLLAWDGQRAFVREPVLLLGLYEEILEDGMVKVRCAHDEPLTTGAHADGHVSGWHVRRSMCGPDASVLAPPLEHLADPDNAADAVGFSHPG